MKVLASSHITLHGVPDNHHFCSLIFALIRKTIYAPPPSSRKRRWTQYQYHNITTIFAQDSDEKKIGANIMAFIDRCAILVVVFQLVYHVFGWSCFWHITVITLLMLCFGSSSDAHYRPIWMPVMFAQIDFTTKRSVRIAIHTDCA